MFSALAQTKRSMAMRFAALHEYEFGPSRTPFMSVLAPLSRHGQA
jgi:hypothetical protein